MTPDFIYFYTDGLILCSVIYILLNTLLHFSFQFYINFFSIFFPLFFHFFPILFLFLLIFISSTAFAQNPLLLKDVFPHWDVRDFKYVKHSKASNKRGTGTHHPKLYFVILYYYSQVPWLVVQKYYDSYLYRCIYMKI